MLSKNKNILFSIVIAIFLSTLVFSTFVILVDTAIAQNNGLDRGIIFYTDYNNIITEKNREINLDIRITNIGEEVEEILFSIVPDEKSEKWTYNFMENWGYFEVRGVKLDIKEPDNLKKMKFRVIVPKEAVVGDYRFILKAETKDLQIQKEIDIIISVDDKKITSAVEEEVIGDVKMTTKYPTLENPAGQEFKYIIKVENNTNTTQILDLGIKLPEEGWSAYCTPQWETDRISAIKLNPGIIENLVLTLIPPLYIEKGDYDLTFLLTSTATNYDIDLKAIVTGTYKLNLKTETEQLNIETIAGEDKKFILNIWNDGSSAIDNLKFHSKVPQNWEIIFTPEEFSSLPPLGLSNKIEKVEVILKTPQRTLTGDYMISLTASGVQDQKTIDIRATVKTSTKWGWIGVLMIVFIFFILIGIFVKLKRR